MYGDERNAKRNVKVIYSLMEIPFVKVLRVNFFIKLLHFFE